MQKGPLYRYRTVLVLGAGYVVAFVVMAVVRLWWDDGGRMDLHMNIPSAVSLGLNLVFVWGAGSLSFLPLIWTLRRFRRSRWIPLVAYAVALPVSLVGTLFGGLLLGPFVVFFAGVPFLLAVAVSFGIQAILGPEPPHSR